MDEDRTTGTRTDGPVATAVPSVLRPPSVRRLWIMVALGVLITLPAVAALVKALSVTEGGRTLVGRPDVGFIVPHRTRPMPFRLRTITGDRIVTLSSLEGKPLVINLWATYCSYCKSETPAVAAVATRESGRVTFVGIDSLEPASAGAAFVKRYHVHYLELSDPTASVDLGYGYDGLPITFFISASGKLVGENLGALTKASLNHYLVKLFGRAAVPHASDS